MVENIFRMMVVNGKDEEDGVEEGEGKGDDDLLFNSSTGGFSRKCFQK